MLCVLLTVSLRPPQENDLMHFGIACWQKCLNKKYHYFFHDTQLYAYDNMETEREGEPESTKNKWMFPFSDQMDKIPFI